MNLLKLCAFVWGCVIVLGGCARSDDPAGSSRTGSMASETLRANLVVRGDALIVTVANNAPEAFRVPAPVWPAGVLYEIRVRDDQRDGQIYIVRQREMAGSTGMAAFPSRLVPASEIATISLLPHETEIWDVPDSLAQVRGKNAYVQVAIRAPTDSGTAGERTFPRSIATQWVLAEPPHSWLWKREGEFGGRLGSGAGDKAAIQHLRKGERPNKSCRVNCPDSDT